MKMKILFLLWSLLFSAGLQAGIMATGTRVIFPATSREKTLMLVNTNEYPVIVQTWVDKGAGDPQSAQAPFIVLPAIFRLSPGERQGVRIIYNQEALPQDRELAFWLNIYEIPPISGKKLTESRVTLAMNTQLKLFWRPKGLSITVEEAADKLTFRLIQKGDSWLLECDNPTPMHISFTSIALLDGLREHYIAPQIDMMIRPFSKRRYPLEVSDVNPSRGRGLFRYLNDAGVPIERTFPLITYESLNLK